MGHNSPENNALVKPRVSPDLDAIFNNGVTVDSFVKAFENKPGLSIHGTSGAFKFKISLSVPVENHTEYCIVLRNHTANCNVENCAANCTGLGSILYKKMGY